MSSLTIDVDLDGGGHGAVGDGLVLGGAPELAEEVVAAEFEPDLVTAGAGAVGLLEGARLACGVWMEAEILINGAPRAISRDSRGHCTSRGKSAPQTESGNCEVEKLSWQEVPKPNGERPNGRTNERPAAGEERSCTERRVLSKFSSPTTSSIYLLGEGGERDKERENGKALSSC